MSVKKEAIKRALVLLRASGARFLIIEDDGVRHGDIKEAVAVKPSSRKLLRAQFDLRSLGYVDTIRALAPGRSHVFQAPDECPVSRLQKAISGTGVKVHGPGNCMTSVDHVRNTVEILRLQ
jgi:hypothetical protein